MSKRILRAFALVTVTIVAGSCGDNGSSGSASELPTGSAPAQQPTAVVIELTEFAYEPRQVTIQPGQTVRWVLRGSDSSHTVTARDGEFDSGFVFQTEGATFEHRFTAEDDGKTFSISCVSHAECCDMKGSIRVGDGAPPPFEGY